MSNDNELQKLFDTQRRGDATIAPSFEETVGGFDSTDAIRTAGTPARPVGTSNVWKSVAMVLALSASTVALFYWGVFSKDNDGGPHAKQRYANIPSRDELQRLDQACDTLLSTIGRLDSAKTAVDVKTEMVWPTETDSLLPLHQLAAHMRTSR